MEKRGKEEIITTHQQSMIAPLVIELIQMIKNKKKVTTMQKVEGDCTVREERKREKNRACC